MARFKYSMQNILDISYKLENQVKADFAVASARVVREEEKLEEIYRQIEAYQDKLRESSGEKLDLNELKYCNQAIEYNKTKAEMQKKQIKKAEEARERVRIRLNQAMKDRKMHETLKDKQFKNFLAELSREESKEIDELISFQYNDRERNKK